MNMAGHYRAVGYLLILTSVILASLFLGMDTSVEPQPVKVDGTEIGIGDGRRVVNYDLMSKQLTGLITAATTFIAGVLFLGLGEVLGAMAVCQMLPKRGYTSEESSPGSFPEEVEVSEEMIAKYLSGEQAILPSSNQRK